MVPGAATITGAGMRAAAVLLRNRRARESIARGLNLLPPSDVGAHGRFTVSVADGVTVTTASARNTYRLTGDAVVLVARAAAQWNGPGGLQAASQILSDLPSVADHLGVSID